MIEQLKQENKVVGAKQTRRALKDHRAKRVYMAQDADPRILQPLVQEAVRQQVPLEQVSTMKALGEACGIACGCGHRRPGVIAKLFCFSRIRSPLFC